MKAWLKKYYLFIMVLMIDTLLWCFYPTRGAAALSASGTYLKEMLLFLPPILVLVGLLDVWVPRQMVEKHVGPDSGVRGVVISILVATAAAGPLYAGFPVAYSLLRKGCRVANAVIFLGTWATIKIPMLMMEIKFMGLTFAALRLALTLPTIVLTGYLLEKILAGNFGPGVLPERDGPGRELAGSAADGGRTGGEGA